MPTVREYMDSDPATVTPDTKVEEVAFLLGRQELQGVPVVDAEGRCVGIVTEDDPTTVGPDADVSEAGRVIATSGHNRLPVVEGERLVGVITRADVVRALTA